MSRSRAVNGTTLTTEARRRRPGTLAGRRERRRAGALSDSGTTVAVPLKRLGRLGRRLAREQPGTEPSEAIARLHERLRPTRGGRRRMARVGTDEVALACRREVAETVDDQRWIAEPRHVMEEPGLRDAVPSGRGEVRRRPQHTTRAREISGSGQRPRPAEFLLGPGERELRAPIHLDPAAAAAVVSPRHALAVPRRDSTSRLGPTMS